MNFPTSFSELKATIENLAFKLWNPTIKSLNDKAIRVEEDVEVLEEVTEEQSELIEENTDEILATKAEVREVKNLLAKLVVELESMGLDIEDPDLLDLMEQEVNEELI